MGTTDRAKRVAENYLDLTGLEVVLIDASTFIEPLHGVAAAVTNLLEREGQKTISHLYMHLDFALTLRHCRSICSLITSLNAEDRLEKDFYCKQEYSFAVLPLIRSMIDGFYNVTVVLQNPQLARHFRASGYKQVLLDSEADAKRYGTNRRFLEHHQLLLRNLYAEWHYLGFTEDEVRGVNKWQLLGRYLQAKPTDTAHKVLLATLTLGYWREYSAISHGTFDGLRGIAPFINRDMVPIDQRSNIELGAYRVITMHMARAHGLLLCLLTELQSVYKFDGFRVNERLHRAWEGLIELAEVRELYEFRYKQLMASLSD